jgi:hypothetical protein
MPVANSPEHLPGTADDEFKANPFSGFSYVHGGSISINMRMRLVFKLKWEFWEVRGDLLDSFHTADLRFTSHFSSP